MSRVADAIRRANDPSLAPDPEPERTVISPAGGDFTFVPWDLGPTGDRTVPGSVAPPLRRVAADTHVVPSRDPVGRPEFADLVQRLFRPGSGDPTARSVLFIDLNPAGSDSGVAVDVARLLAAQRVGSVCLADVSFGSATLHERLSVAQGPGFCDALLSGYQAASVAVSAGDDLWVIPAGGAMSDQPEWVPAAATRALRQVGTRFDFVIGAAAAKDTSIPTLMSLASGSDGVVLVLDKDRTRRDAAAAMLDRLRDGGVVVFGAVFREPGKTNGSGRDH